MTFDTALKVMLLVMPSVVVVSCTGLYQARAVRITDAAGEQLLSFYESAVDADAEAIATIWKENNLHPDTMTGYTVIQEEFGKVKSFKIINANADPLL